MTRNDWMESRKPRDHDFNWYVSKTRLSLYEAVAILKGFALTEIPEDPEESDTPRDKTVPVDSYISHLTDDSPSTRRKQEVRYIEKNYSGLLFKLAEAADEGEIGGVAFSIETRAPDFEKDGLLKWATDESLLEIDYSTYLSRDTLPVEACMWLLFKRYLPPAKELMRTTRDLGEYRYEEEKVQRFWEAVADACEENKLRVRSNTSGKIKRVAPADFFGFALERGEDLPEAIKSFLDASGTTERARTEAPPKPPELELTVTEVPEPEKTVAQTPVPKTEPEANISKKSGKWVICFEGEKWVGNDIKRTRQLVALIRHQGESVEALMLVDVDKEGLLPERTVGTALVETAEESPDSTHRKNGQNAEEVGDRQTKEELGRELREQMAYLESGVPEQERRLVEEEITRLRRELDKIVDIHGNLRRISAPDNRAVRTVRKNLKQVIKDIEPYCPDFAAHLDSSLDYGKEVSYRPKPAVF